MMDQRAAFRDTIALAEQQGMPEWPGPLGLTHLRSMCEQAQAFTDDTKLGRWLGWAQCAVVAAAIDVTLEDMAEINRRHTEGDQ